MKVQGQVTANASGMMRSGTLFETRGYGAWVPPRPAPGLHLEFGHREKHGHDDVDLLGDPAKAIHVVRCGAVTGHLHLAARRVEIDAMVDQSSLPPQVPKNPSL
jgi:hypothetical protein